MKTKSLRAALLLLTLFVFGCNSNSFYEHSEKVRAKRAECRDYMALHVNEVNACVELTDGKVIQDEGMPECRRFAEKIEECGEYVDLVQILRTGPRQPVDIAIVWPQDPHEGQLVSGAILAQEEVNRQGGVLNGRPIKLWFFDDTFDIADKVSNNLDLLAAIGHHNSETSIPASITYEYRGMLYLSPRATLVALTSHRFSYVFRTIPNNKQMAAQLAHFVKLQGYKRIVLLYSRDPYAEEVAAKFYENAVNNDTQIVHRASFFEHRRNFRSLIADFRGKKFDAIFLAAWPAAAAKVIKQTRDMGIKEQPFIGVDAMDSGLLAERAGSAADGTVVPTVYDARAVTSQDSVRFINNFQARFNRTPDTWAAQGYDGVKLLAYAMNDAKSTVPLAVATTLRYLNFWLGVTGAYRFDRSGDIYGKLYKFNELKDGRFESIGSAHLHYAFDQIKKYKLLPPAQAKQAQTTQPPTQ